MQYSAWHMSDMMYVYAAAVQASGNLGDHQSYMGQRSRSCGNLALMGQGAGPTGAVNQQSPTLASPAAGMQGMFSR